MAAPCDFGGHTSHQCVPPAGRRAWNVVPLLSAGRDGACETQGPPAPPRTRTHARTPLRFNSVSKTRYFVTLSVPFPHPVTWKFSDVVAPNPALASHLPSLCGRRRRVGRPPPAPLLVRGRASSLIPRLLHWSLSKAGPRPQAGRPCARAGPGPGKGPGLGGRARAPASQRPCRNDGQGPACSEWERRLSPLHQALGRVLHPRGTTTKPHPPYPVSVRRGRAGFRAGFHCGAGMMLSTGCLRTWWLRGTRWSGERAGGSGPQRSPPGTGFRGFCPGLELSLLVAVPVA